MLGNGSVVTRGRQACDGQFTAASTPDGKDAWFATELASYAPRQLPPTLYLEIYFKYVIELHQSAFLMHLLFNLQFMINIFY